LLFYYGETMECLSSNVTLRILSKYRAELITEGKSLQELDFKSQTTLPLIEGLRPLDYIHRIKSSNDLIKISIPQRWSIEYPKRMRPPRLTARSSLIHLTWEWN